MSWNILQLISMGPSPFNSLALCSSIWNHHWKHAQTREYDARMLELHPGNPTFLASDAVFNGIVGPFRACLAWCDINIWCWISLEIMEGVGRWKFDQTTLWRFTGKAKSIIPSHLPKPSLQALRTLGPSSSLVFLKARSRTTLASPS